MSESKTLVTLVDFDKEKQRAVCLCNRDGKVFFGLVVNRKTRSQTYLCFYVGLKIAEFHLIATNDSFSNVYSFIGISNDTIMVPKAISDRLLMDQPEHFIGIDVHEQVTPSERLAELADGFWDKFNEVMTHHAADA